MYIPSGKNHTVERTGVRTRVDEMRQAHNVEQESKWKLEDDTNCRTWSVEGQSVCNRVTVNLRNPNWVLDDIDRSRLAESRLDKNQDEHERLK